MLEAVIVSAVRTSVGAHGGALAAVRPDDLAALVIAEAVRRAEIDPGQIEEVYLGCANQAGGGGECMSRSPYAVPKPEQAFAWGNMTMWDTTLGWRFPNPRIAETFGIDSMGETAENLAEAHPEITREMQDAFSVESHRRALAAIDSGRFAEEIVPVPIPQPKGDPLVVSIDERPRRASST